MAECYGIGGRILTGISGRMAWNTQNGGAIRKCRKIQPLRCFLIGKNKAAGGFEKEKIRFVGCILKIFRPISLKSVPCHPFNPNVAYFFEVAAGFSLRITQPKECAKHHILVKAAATSIPEYTQGDIYHNCES